MKPTETFICATCKRTTDVRLAVSVQLHAFGKQRICAHCENAIIGFGEEAGIAAIRQEAHSRDLHLVQAGMLEGVA